MSRMVSVWLPALPIERLKLTRNGKPFPVDRPFALVGSEDRGLVLTALNAAAMRAGLISRHGSSRRPRHLSAPPHRACRTGERCRRRLLALARWSGRYSPSLNVDGDDGLWLDVSGVPHLFGGDRALLDDMAKRFARLGFSARLALPRPWEALMRLPATRTPLPSSSRRERSRRPWRRFPWRPCALTSDDHAAAEAARPEAHRPALRFAARLARAAVPLTRSGRSRASSPRSGAWASRGAAHPLLPAPDYAARLPFPEPLITHEGVVAGLDHLAEKLCQALNPRPPGRAAPAALPSIAPTAPLPSSTLA